MSGTVHTRTQEIKHISFTYRKMYPGLRYSSCRALTICMLLGTLASLPQTLVYAIEEDYQVEISKSDKELIIKKGGETIKRFDVSLGKGGKGTKQRLGDNKTPIGVYKITDFKANSKFHYFMQIDYPNLLDAWYGYKNNIITAKEFKRIAFAFKGKQRPPQDTPLGGYIGIHGLGESTGERLKIHETFDWTEGCIALKNSEITALRQYVSIGTRVTIKE
ncbi:MAG: murein L,D-transpeptidase YafK [Gammaproteobacteria bacterium]|jgi:murein L,D-transpeptidase YafK